MLTKNDNSDSTHKHKSFKHSLLILIQQGWVNSITKWAIFTKHCRFTPPFSFLRTTNAGGSLFSLIPKPSSSRSIIRLWTSGFSTSRTIKIRLQVRATEENKVVLWREIKNKTNLIILTKIILVTLKSGINQTNI